DQHIADAADLPAIGSDIRQHLPFHIGIAGLAKIDIDHAKLASDRTEEGRERVDRLHDISGKRHLECRHGQTSCPGSGLGARGIAATYVADRAARVIHPATVTFWSSAGNLRISGMARLNSALETPGATQIKASFRHH